MDRPRDKGLYGLIWKDGMPDHDFDANTGICKRCLTDAENWDEVDECAEPARNIEITEKGKAIS